MATCFGSSEPSSGQFLIQGEHKNTPWFQVVIKSKLTGIFLYTWDCRYCTGISLSARFSTSTCQTDGLAGLDKMARCSASGHRDHRTWPFVTCVYVKDRFYVPPLPATGDELQERITATVKSVTPDMLQRVWSEIDYLTDVCRVTIGGTLRVCDTTWNCMSLCNCSQQFCKNFSFRITPLKPTQ